MLIGLTGAIGGGKSTALAAFSALGCRIEDADRLCHQLYLDPEVKQQILARWGSVADDRGEIDRRKLGRIVFAHPEELAQLTEIILYPRLGKSMEELRKSAARGGVTVAEIPLLFESGWERYCDVTLALWTGSGLRHARLLKRGLTPPEIAEREAQQWSEEKKLETADRAIMNTGSPAFLQMQCNRLIKDLGR